jgi:hypothetical protein
MKHLLFVFALSAPCLSMAAGVPAQTPPAQSGVVAKPAKSPSHRPLIDVKFVLVRAPPEENDAPQLDFGNGKPAIVPLPSSRWDTVPLGADPTNPNAYWCRNWGCRSH